MVPMEENVKVQYNRREREGPACSGEGIDGHKDALITD